MCAALPALTHTYSYPLFFFFSLPGLVPCIYSHSSGSTVLLFTRHLCHLAGEVSHFSLQHSPSDFPPVINTTPIWLGWILLLIIIYLRSQILGKGRWVGPDSEAAERAVLPSGPHWDQHNTSAWSRYITSHQRLQDTRCLSHGTGRATECSPRS